jgi:hypothetical protein
MSHRHVGLPAGALAILMALVLVTSAAAVPVSVRIVGDDVGVEANVDTAGGTFGPSSCPGDSAGGAIDKATAGNWDRMAFTSTILGEAHVYAASDYWNFWINDAYSATEGICDHVVSPGDRVLMLVQRDSATFAPTVFPLRLSGVPATVAAGVPFSVTVDELRTDGRATTPTPLAGATVSGGGATAQTDAAGHATVTLSTAGAAVLRATRTGNVASDAATVDVVAPAAVLAGTPPPPPPAPLARDLRAPAASVVSIAEGRRFGHGFGPRELRVRVDPDVSGLLMVKLRLTRTDHGRCSYFSGTRERFVVTGRGRCHASDGFWFRVGDRAETSYLLPGRLGPGRYVLDVNAIDKAYNRDDVRRRGANRVVFHVG